MNVGEFKQLLEDRKIPDDTRLTIQFRGGLAGSTVPAKSAYPGFDWTAKQLVITPETDLVIDEWYRLLKKGSGHDASHVGALVKSVEAILDQHDDGDHASALNGLIVDLQKSIDRLARFQKQGF